MADRSAHAHNATESHSPYWVERLVVLAGVVMIVTGFFHAIIGIAAWWSEVLFVTTPEYVFRFSVAGWGWVHLITGVVVVITGIALLSGVLSARVGGIVIAALSAIASFLFLPYHPIWSALIIAADMLVIWALVVYTPTTPRRARSR